jgi:hypothetical protein
MNARLAVAAALLVMIGRPLGAGERIVVRVSPSVAFEPANLVVRTTVESNDENRSIEIIAESLEFYRSSEIPLDGARAPRTTLIEFRDLPSGFYYVRAVLRGSTGREIASAHDKINVIEGLGDARRY